MKVSVNDSVEAQPPPQLPWAELAPLTKQPPMGLDRTSQLLIFSQQQLEPKRNQQELLAHTFPWNYLVIVTLLCMAGWGAALAVQYVKRQIAMRRAVRRPMELALKQLDELEQGDLSARGDFDLFYARLTQVIRYYVEAKTGISVIGKTSQELLENVIDNGYFSAQEEQLLADLMSYADQVKFANQSSTLADCQTASSYARELIKR